MIVKDLLNHSFPISSRLYFKQDECYQQAARWNATDISGTELRHLLVKSDIDWCSELSGKAVIGVTIMSGYEHKPRSHPFTERSSEHAMLTQAHDEQQRANRTACPFPARMSEIATQNPPCVPSTARAKGSGGARAHVKVHVATRSLE